MSVPDSRQDRDQEGYARLHLSAVEATALEETETFVVCTCDVFNFCGFLILILKVSCAYLLAVVIVACRDESSGFHVD